MLKLNMYAMDVVKKHFPTIKEYTIKKNIIALIVQVYLEKKQ
jgi:hypothetical protein